jgi:hypothetical protein
MSISSRGWGETFVSCLLPQPAKPIGTWRLRGSPLARRGGAAISLAFALSSALEFAPCRKQLKLQRAGAADRLSADIEQDAATAADRARERWRSQTAARSASGSAEILEARMLFSGSAIRPGGIRQPRNISKTKTTEPRFVSKCKTTRQSRRQSWCRHRR